MLDNAEERHSFSCRIADRILVIQALERFVEDATDKFVRGAKEHTGQPLTERVTLTDIEDELIDSWFYTIALKRKALTLLRND